jgi:hypothetical protein
MDRKGRGAESGTPQLLAKAVKMAQGATALGRSGFRATENLENGNETVKPIEPKTTSHVPDRLLGYFREPRRPGGLSERFSASDRDVRSSREVRWTEQLSYSLRESLEEIPSLFGQERLTFSEAI